MRFYTFVLAVSAACLAAAHPQLLASKDIELEGRTTCSTPEGSGTCQSTSSCGTFSVAGYCPGSSSIQCCVSQSCSTSSGTGTCKSTSNGCSGGTFIAGACPGSSSIQCCVSNSCSTPQGTGTCESTSSCSGYSLAGYCPGSASNQCCLSQSCSTPQGSGSCKNTGNGCSGGTFVSGYCPGSSSVQCCVPNSSSSSCSTPSGSGTCQSTSSCSGASIAGYCPGSSSNQCCVSNIKCSTSQGSGTCKNTGLGCSGGAFIAGACPGSSSVECCVPGATSGGGGSPPPPSGSDIPTVDISSSKSDAWFQCAAGTYKKLIVRGYSQACGEGGEVDSNMAAAAAQAKAAGFGEIEAYLYPCTGSQPTGVACKDPATQLAEFEAAVAAAGLSPSHLWLDIEPTSYPSEACNSWQLGTSGNIALAQQWVSLLRASKYSYGIYANAGQWSEMFGTTSQSIGATDLPLWAVQDNGVPGVGTTTAFMGGWTVAYGKQYNLGATVCGLSDSADISSFNG